MIKQYAVEPEAITDWQRLRYFADQCGVSRGRVISRLPSDWEARVFRQINASTRNQNDLKKVEVKLQQLRVGKQFVKREGARFDPERDWLDNAVREHRRCPFTAIVARENPASNPVVLDADSLDAENPLWRTDTCVTIRRVAREFGDVARPLLDISKGTLLVDPYFRSHRSDFTRVLTEISLHVHSSKHARFEYHFCTENAVLEWSDARSRLTRVIPSGLHMTLVAWPPRAFHNRYVLTEVGGMHFGHGLSEAGRFHKQHDEVSLLSDESHEGLLRDFQHASSNGTRPTLRL